MVGAYNHSYVGTPINIGNIISFWQCRVKRSFRKFAGLVPSGGSVIINQDDAWARSVACGLDSFTFGLEPGAECTAADLREEGGLPVFDIMVHGERYAHAELQVYGRHNVSNALAAASAAYVLGGPGSAVEEGLRGFRGAGRRFERKGEYNEAVLYDDYAHHPQELCSLLTTAKGLGYRRVVCAFQPHTYSRTKELFDDFVEVSSCLT